MAARKNPAASRSRVRAEETPSDEDISAQLEPTGDSAKHDVFARLAQTIESEIIPRLLIAHKAGAPIDPAVLEPAAVFDVSQVEAFAALTFAVDGSRCHAYLDSMRAEGKPLESIIMELMAPAAALLGELWKADVCTFTEVTVGLSRLRQMLRELSPDFESEASSWQHGRRALLLPAPGEQHTFGLFIVEAFFRREGWDIWGGTANTSDDVMDLVGHHWFAVAGFSLASERHVGRLTDLIRDVRRGSSNPEIGVLVGGPLFLEKPELVAHVGADGSASDGRGAVIQARNLLEQVSARG